MVDSFNTLQRPRGRDDKAETLWFDKKRGVYTTKNIPEYAQPKEFMYAPCGSSF